MVTWVGEREVSGIPEAAWLCGGVAGCRTYARAGGRALCSPGASPLRRPSSPKVVSRATGTAGSVGLGPETASCAMAVIL